MIYGIVIDSPKKEKQNRGVRYVVFALNKKGIHNKIINIADFTKKEVLGLDFILFFAKRSTPDAKRLYSLCNKLQIPCFNSDKDELSTDKWATYLKLTHRKISTPVTTKISRFQEGIFSGEYAIIKPAKEEGGHNVCRVLNNPEAIRNFLKKVNCNNLILQEYIDTKAVHKFCFIGNRLSAYFVREFGWNKDGKLLQKRYFLKKPSKSLRSLAFAARKYCLCEFCGVDILSNGTKNYVLEFNAPFGFRGSRMANPRIIDELIEFAISKI